MNEESQRMPDSEMKSSNEQNVSQTQWRVRKVTIKPESTDLDGEVSVA
jgi:hypothetical protein